MTDTQDHNAMLLLQEWSLNRSALLSCFQAEKDKLQSELKQGQESLYLDWNPKPRLRTTSDHLKYSLAKLDLYWQHDAKLKELEFQHKEAIVNHYNAFPPFASNISPISSDITTPSDTADAIPFKASTSTRGPRHHALQLKQVPLQQGRVAKRSASPAIISDRPQKRNKVQIASTANQVTVPISRSKL
ncbi:hypothetical protein LZ30DRAFT_742786, partial [Colletotrichum cereale]